MGKNREQVIGKDSKAILSCYWDDIPLSFCDL